MSADPHVQVSMKNPQFFKQANSTREKRRARNDMTEALMIVQPFPAERVTVYDPTKQLYAHGRRLYAISGALKGKLIRVMYVRAQLEDCQDYDSYAVGFGETALYSEWIPVADLATL